MWRLLNVTKTAALSLLLVAGIAHAAKQDDGEQRLTNFLTDVETLTASFEQVLIDASGSIVEQSAGTLQLSRPGRFRWVYTEPYEQWLVADGLNVWSYDVDLAQVTVKAQSLAPANTPALLLGGTAEVLDEFRVEESFEDGGLSWVRLVPLNTESGFMSVELAFNGETLERMVFFDNLEQTTVVTLRDTELNTAIDASEFEFDLPEDVDVVGTAAVATSDDH